MSNFNEIAVTVSLYQYNDKRNRYEMTYTGNVFYSECMSVNNIADNVGILLSQAYMTEGVIAGNHFKRKTFTGFEVKTGDVINIIDTTGKCLYFIIGNLYPIVTFECPAFAAIETAVGDNLMNQDIDPKNDQLMVLGGKYKLKGSYDIDEDGHATIYTSKASGVIKTMTKIIEKSGDVKVLFANSPTPITPSADSFLLNPDDEELTYVVYISDNCFVEKVEEDDK